MTEDRNPPARAVAGTPDGAKIRRYQPMPTEGRIAFSVSQQDGFSPSITEGLLAFLVEVERTDS